MKAALTPSWELSTEHPPSSCGRLVLVHRQTNEACGPGDIVRLYPSHGYAPAAHGVARLARRTQLALEAEALVNRFVGSLPSVE